ncbi:MAG: hypothetical protein HYS76_01140, partial [Candidatus Wildermuthbacteria bacterium]|nr:hypothetical protein [Candidatus Wildermuthbacteria bacterium]
QTVQNILLASGAARELGMTLENIAHACESITPATGAITLQKGINNIAIINSSYSANPDGVISDLEYLALWPGKKIIVMPCLIELGSASATVHERIGRAIGRMCDLAIITTRDRFDSIQKGAMESEMPSSRILCSDNPSRIASLLSLPAYEQATVLLEGRSSREIINRIIIP